MSADTIIKPDKETKAETKPRELFRFQLPAVFILERRRRVNGGVHA